MLRFFIWISWLNAYCWLDRIQSVSPHFNYIVLNRYCFMVKKEYTVRFDTTREYVCKWQYPANYQENDTL